MRKISKILVVVLCVLSICTILASCGNNDTAGTMTLIVGETEYTVDLSKVEGNDGLFAVLRTLEKQGELTYTANGNFLTQVGNLQQDARAGVYLYIYTSVEEDFDVSVYATEKDYKEKKLVSSGVGADSMHVKKDCYIKIETVLWA